MADDLRNNVWLWTPVLISRQDTNVVVQKRHHSVVELDRATAYDVKPKLSAIYE